MATVVRLAFKTAPVQQAIQRLEQRAPQAITRALNRAITGSRVEMRRVMGKDLGLKQGTIDKDLRVGLAHPEKQIASLEVRGKRIPLIDFGARGPEPSRGKGRGVTARLGGKSSRYPHAFIATMRSGHRGVFTRKAGVGRLPIIELRGPSLVKVFLRFRQVGIARGVDALVKNLQSEFRFAMQQARSAA